MPVLSTLLTIFLDLAIYRDGDEPVGFDVLELDHLVTVACELSPAAGFFGILFDRGVLVTVFGERYCSQALAAGTADRETLAVEFYAIAGHHLGSNGL